MHQMRHVVETVFRPCEHPAHFRGNRMKAYITAITICLIASNAHAVPTGCFITDTSSYCYNGSFFASDCDQLNMTSYYFGTYVASMCGYVNALESVASGAASSLNQCNNDFNVIVSQRDACVTDKNTCVALATSIEKNRQDWIAYARGREEVIKKMQRACGAKCRKIK